jgi:nucleotide-binding universal stress UspA family protein
LLRNFRSVFTLPTQESLLEELSSLNEQRSRIAREGGPQHLEAAKKRAISNGVTNLVSRLRRGELVDTFAEMEGDARLFVIGQRGEAAEAAPQHIGSHLERVVRALHKPILVAQKEFCMVRTVMVAFDGSAPTRKGIDMLASSLLFRGCECHIVMVGTNSPANMAQLDWAKHNLQASTSTVTTSLVGGEPECGLAEYVRMHEIDMLVMGVYSHSRFR